MYLKGSQVVKCSNFDVFLYLKTVLTSAKSADPDEMQHYAAFHLGLHCLPKYPIMGFPVYKGLMKVT